MDDNKEFVVLVDEEGNKLGTMPKLEAHMEGVLHRAFSIFIFNDKNEMLLQKRASNKYHSPNLWSNTCCSHPRDNETIIEAGKRRLKEEMGVNCNIEEKHNFIYKSNVGKGLIEYEYDTILTGVYNATPNINLEEVSEYKWIKIKDIEKDIKINYNKYTEWFKIVLKEYSKFLK